MSVVEDDAEPLCRKDIGNKKKLRRWSRGHQFLVRGGGHIETWQPLYKYVNKKVYRLVIFKCYYAIHIQ